MKAVAKGGVAIARTSVTVLVMPAFSMPALINQMARIVFFLHILLAHVEAAGHVHMSI